MALVPCNNPEHGVAFHKAGSAAAESCAGTSRSGSAAVIGRGAEMLSRLSTSRARGGRFTNGLVSSSLGITTDDGRVPLPATPDDWQPSGRYDHDDLTDDLRERGAEDAGQADFVTRGRDGAGAGLTYGLYSHVEHPDGVRAQVSGVTYHEGTGIVFDTTTDSNQRLDAPKVMAQLRQAAAHDARDDQFTPLWVRHPDGSLTQAERVRIRGGAFQFRLSGAQD